jgi:hypothetical protein
MAGRQAGFFFSPRDVSSLCMSCFSSLFYTDVHLVFDTSKYYIFSAKTSNVPYGQTAFNLKGFTLHLGFAVDIANRKRGLMVWSFVPCRFKILCRLQRRRFKKIDFKRTSNEDVIVFGMDHPCEMVIFNFFPLKPTYNFGTLGLGAYIQLWYSRTCLKDTIHPEGPSFVQS